MRARAQDDLSWTDPVVPEWNWKRNRAAEPTRVRVSAPRVKLSYRHRASSSHQLNAQPATASISLPPGTQLTRANTNEQQKGPIERKLENMQTVMCSCGTKKFGVKGRKQRQQKGPFTQPVQEAAGIWRSDADFRDTQHPGGGCLQSSLSWSVSIWPGVAHFKHLNMHNCLLAFAQYL